MHAMIYTRPNTVYAVEVVSRHLSNLENEHWNTVKWILRYLRGTTKRCLCFSNGDLILLGYANATTVRDVDNRKSTSGYLITFVGGVAS